MEQAMADPQRSEVGELTGGAIDLNEAKRIVEGHTGRLSSLSRQLSFAGIGVVWVLVGGTSRRLLNSHFPNSYYWAMLMFVVSLGCDFLQYLYASTAWSIFRRKKELEVISGENDSFLAPKQINWATNVFFYAKSACVLSGYVILVVVIGARLH
jgi:hypothetical protein